MTPPLFLAETAALDHGRTVMLDGAEGRHAATVRRLARGERVDVTDGAGLLVETTVTSATRDRLTLEVTHRRSVPPPTPRLVVVQALVKGDRGELAVELMTEVGVDEVVPWTAARSVMQWHGARGERALERWRTTAREAAKQSRRPWLPVIAPLATTAEVAARLAAAELPVVLSEESSTPLVGVPPPVDGEVVLVVGPEGGLTGEELAAYDAMGASRRRLGPTVLRASTAGAAAVAILSAATGRWGSAVPAPSPPLSPPPSPPSSE